MIERIYTIPLRKEYLKVPRWRRAEKSMKFIREFIARHMKTEKVVIGNDVNEHIWQFGGKKVVGRVKVVVRKTNDKVEVHLFGYKWPEEKKQKEEKKKSEQKTEQKAESDAK